MYYIINVTSKYKNVHPAMCVTFKAKSLLVTLLYSCAVCVQYNILFFLSAFFEAPYFSFIRPVILNRHLHEKFANELVLEFNKKSMHKNKQT